MRPTTYPHVSMTKRWVEPSSATKCSRASERVWGHHVAAIPGSFTISHRRSASCGRVDRERALLLFVRIAPTAGGRLRGAAAGSDSPERKCRLSFLRDVEEGERRSSS